MRNELVGTAGVLFLSALVVFSFGPVIGYENGAIAGGMLTVTAGILLWCAANEPPRTGGRD